MSRKKTAADKPTWFEEWSGQTVIRIYRLQRAGKPAGFQFRYYVGEESKRVTRADEQEIRSEARRIAVGIENGRVAAADLSAADVQSYTHAVQQLESLGPTAPPLHVALEEYVAARALLPPGMTLPEVVRSFVKLRPPSMSAAKVADLVAPFLADAGDTVNNPRHRRGLRNDLGRFAAWLPAGKLIADVTAAEIQTYLRALVEGTLTHRWHSKAPEIAWPAVGPRRRDNVRNEIAAFFAWAKLHRHLPEDRLTQAELVKPLKAVHEIKYYTPEQLCGFLVHVNDEWLPWFVLGAFAGIRSSEIVGDPEDPNPNRPRLRWSDFRWDKGYIVVPALAAKKIKRSRRVPLRANLLEWLLPWRKVTGFLYGHGADQSDMTQIFAKGPVVGRDERGEAIRAAPLPWDKNALRHSYGTHRNAEISNAGQLAEEMGTSVSMIRKYYDAVPADVDPKTYFGVRPDVSHTSKIIRFAGQ